jgi:mono/diheme cytochrome c family protein
MGSWPGDRSRAFFSFAVLATLWLVPHATAQQVDFSRRVLPILATHCFTCHGPDAAKLKADLRLDRRESVVAERDGQPAVAPGKPDASSLIARVTAEDKAGRMPPPKAGARLSSAQVQILRDWIAQGAKYTEHWAFVTPKRPMLPEAKDRSWARTPVDLFIQQALEQNRLGPARQASRVALIRRVTLDLTGLPPTPEEIDAFVGDQSVDAWERLVARLMESPHYGERWGRHWLDVARYADSGGFETDIFFGHAWRYRDYVIRCFNTDKPFDRFVREQIAGDELFPGDQDARLATTLYTIAPVLQEAAMVPGKLEYDLLTDAADTTGAAFLGLTVGCARCHDHKYDPISQLDYYGLQAFFGASEQCDVLPDGTRTTNGGRIAVKSTQTEFEIEQMRARAKCETDPAVRERYLRKIGDYFLGNNAKKKKGAPAGTSSSNSAQSPEAMGAEHLEGESVIPVRVLVHRKEPLEVHLLKRGELDQPGPSVQPALPARLAGAPVPPAPADRRRAALADWVASPRNPLTARVLVNRLWQWHFGQGLVATPNDFGVRGEPPTHPELLDWLTVEFMEHGWSIKHIHRLIVLSSAYQMSSVALSDTLARDPDNRLLSRFQPRRLEAEVVWDSLRAVSGTLDSAMYGLPMAPALDQQEQIGNFRKWPTSLPEESNRRGIYLLVKRSFRFPMLSAFDLPDNVTSCGRRDVTTIPNQALTLLNNRTIREQAGIFAGRLLHESGGELNSLLQLAWKRAYGREPGPDEVRQAKRFIDAHGGAGAAKHGMGKAVEELCMALFNTNEFIYAP